MDNHACRSQTLHLASPLKVSLGVRRRREGLLIRHFNIHGTVKGGEMGGVTPSFHGIIFDAHYLPHATIVSILKSSAPNVIDDAIT